MKASACFSPAGPEADPKRGYYRPLNVARAMVAVAQERLSELKALTVEV